MPARIPEIDVVHTARVTIDDKDVKKVLNDEYIVVGQALSAEIQISHTRQWGRSQGPDQQLSFCFDVQADPESWIVGGARRSSFTAKVILAPRPVHIAISLSGLTEFQEHELLTFPLLLLPQRTGHLVLPSVKIWALPIDHSNQSSPPRNLVCETDNTTETKTILVIPSLGSTTVAFDPSESGPGAWLVRSSLRDA